MYSITDCVLEGYGKYMCEDPEFSREWTEHFLGPEATFADYLEEGERLLSPFEKKWYDRWGFHEHFLRKQGEIKRLWDVPNMVLNELVGTEVYVAKCKPGRHGSYMQPIEEAAIEMDLPELTLESAKEFFEEIGYGPYLLDYTGNVFCMNNETRSMAQLRMEAHTKLMRTLTKYELTDFKYIYRLYPTDMKRYIARRLTRVSQRRMYRTYESQPERFKVFIESAFTKTCALRYAEWLLEKIAEGDASVCYRKNWRDSNARKIAAMLREYGFETRAEFDARMERETKDIWEGREGAEKIIMFDPYKFEVEKKSYIFKQEHIRRELVGTVFQSWAASQRPGR